MINIINIVRKLFLGLPLSEGNFSSLGFEEGGKAQNRLEQVGKTVIYGYNCAVECGLSEELYAIEATVEEELKGFFNEGVGMGLYTLDLFSFRKKSRLNQHIQNQQQAHEYMSYIGAGLASGVFKRSFQTFLTKTCPMSGCLIIDGIGFYYAMFQPEKGIKKQFVPKKIKRHPFYQKRYDNGLGRAVWFYNCGDPIKINQTVRSFPEERQPHIWSGIGLAATYAGGVEESKIRLLKELAAQDSSYLGQGSFLAAHTRHRAENPHRDDLTTTILTNRKSSECHQFAMQIRSELEGKHLINGVHSFDVFLSQVRNWLNTAQKKTLTNLAA